MRITEILYLYTRGSTVYPNYFKNIKAIYFIFLINYVNAFVLYLLWHTSINGALHIVAPLCA